MKGVETSDPLISFIGLIFAQDSQSHSTLTDMSNKRTLVFAIIHIAQFQFILGFKFRINPGNEFGIETRYQLGCLSVAANSRLKLNVYYLFLSKMDGNG